MHSKVVLQLELHYKMTKFAIWSQKDIVITNIKTANITEIAVVIRSMSITLTIQFQGIIDKNVCRCWNRRILLVPELKGIGRPVCENEWQWAAFAMKWPINRLSPPTLAAWLLWTSPATPSRTPYLRSFALFCTGNLLFVVSMHLALQVHITWEGEVACLWRVFMVVSQKQWKNHQRSLIRSDGVIPPSLLGCGKI